ncbi:uncharacterized protein F4812DRAFT_428631 [Daldinia caldariorum]|uniref:uncharacterized protein n=1 Tax=Daldinia caldariorum TaxID=326644 RepID=UPI002007AD9F|nr:uncharacterized protein F4812DRAFT_428631 [Daldinia caldariorum]KAI1468043.1 hypothetical protein F4812DRAFT_428631 [Daldinia caldariorum]
MFFCFFVFFFFFGTSFSRCGMFEFGGSSNNSGSTANVSPSVVSGNELTGSKSYSILSSRRVSCIFHCYYTRRYVGVFFLSRTTSLQIRKYCPIRIMKFC